MSGMGGMGGDTACDGGTAMGQCRGQYNSGSVGIGAAKARDNAACDGGTEGENTKDNTTVVGVVACGRSDAGDIIRGNTTVVARRRNLVACSLYVTGTLGDGARGRSRQALCSSASPCSLSTLCCPPVPPHTGLKVPGTVVWDLEDTA